MRTEEEKERREKGGGEQGEIALWGQPQFYFENNVNNKNNIPEVDFLLL